MPDFAKIADLLEQLAALLRDDPPPPAPSPGQLPILNSARVAVLKRMQADNHAYWQQLLADADRLIAGNPVDDEQGQSAAIVYVVTGDLKYADAAWARLLATMQADPMNADSVREGFLQYLLVYAWIQASLSNAQKSQFTTLINRWADFAYGVGQKGGFNFADTDQTIGQYFGLQVGVMLNVLSSLDSDGLIVFGADAGKHVGGLDASAADRTTARNAIRLYVEGFAAGGDWFESSQYNSNTVVLLLMGWMALADLLGEDHFPEIAAWVPSACDAVLTTFTPDLKSRVEWGDDEQAGGLMLYKQIPFVAALISAADRIPATNQLERLATLLAEMENVNAGAAVRGRFYYFANPYITPLPVLLPRWTYSAGLGQLRRIDGNNLFFAFSPRRDSADWDRDHLPTFVGDVRLYAGGEWVLNHPEAYSPVTDRAEGVNSIRLSGLSAMLKMGPLDCQQTADYSYFACGTSGVYDVNSKTAPASWCSEVTRTIFYLPALPAIFICDRINCGAPTDTDPTLAAYSAADRALVQAAKHRKEVVWHFPGLPASSPDHTVWQTTGGQNVELFAWSLTGPFSADGYDESQLWSGIDSMNGVPVGWQIRHYWTADRPFDVLLSCVLLNPQSGPALVSVGDGNVASGIQLGDTAVLFGVDEATRLLDPKTPGIASAKTTYLAGCSGDTPVIAA